MSWEFPSVTTRRALVDALHLEKQPQEGSAGEGGREAGEWWSRDGARPSGFRSRLLPPQGPTVTSGGPFSGFPLVAVVHTVENVTLGRVHHSSSRHALPETVLALMSLQAPREPSGENSQAAASGTPPPAVWATCG